MEKRPLGLLIAQRRCIECLRPSTEIDFCIHSSEWGRQQMADSARALQAGSRELLTRDFSPLYIARGDVERPFHQRLQILYDNPDMWSTQPLSCSTVDFNAFIFKLLSRMECLVEQGPTHDRQTFPTPLYLLLQQPSLGAQMNNIDACLLDPWTAELVADHPGMKEDDHVLHAKILAKLAKLSKDNSSQENDFAWFRRQLVMRSVQTHTYNFGDLNGE